MEEGKRPTFTWTISKACLLGLAWLVESLLVGFSLMLTDARRYLPFSWSSFIVGAEITIAALVLAAAIFCVIFLRRGFPPFLESIQSRGRGPILIPAAVGGLLAIALCLMKGCSPNGPLSWRFVVPAVLFYVFGQVLLGPFMEEVYFRGILWRAVTNEENEYWALAIVTVVFVLIHPKHLANVIPIAIALGLIRWKTQSIFSSFAAHAAYNLMLILNPFLIESFRR